MAGIRKVEFVTSQKGTLQVLLDGYVYNKNVVRQTCIHWKCVKSTCKWRLSTSGDFVRHVTDHNHTPEDGTRICFVSNLRKRAREETVKMSSLYNDEVAKQNDPRLLPSFPSMSSALYRHRRKTTSVDKIRGWSQRHLDGDIWWETFPSVEWWWWRQDSCFYNKWATQGPSVSWNVVHGRNIYLLSWTLESSVYHSCKVMAPSVQCGEWVSWHRSERVLLPLLPGHLAQDPRTRTGRSVQGRPRCPVMDRKSCRPCPPSCRCRPGHMDWCHGVNARCSKSNWVQWLHCIDDDARFPIKLWNHHQTVGPRTNNNLKGFHSRLNQTLPHRHPNIFRFIEVIKNIETADKAKIAQLDFGAAPTSRKRVYREIENKLLRLKDKLAIRQKTPLEFLDAVGHILKLA